MKLKMETILASTVVIVYTYIFDFCMLMSILPTRHKVQRFGEYKVVPLIVSVDRAHQ